MEQIAMSNMSKNRIVWIDNVRAFGIFLVVFAHFIPYRSSFGLHKFIYGFHMPLFFFLSGYLNKQRIKNHTFSSFLKSKSLSLIKPYITYSVIGFILYCAVSLSKEINPFSLQSILDIVGAKCRDLYKFYTVPLWFLVCLFVVEIHFYFLSKVKRIYELLTVILFSCLTIFIFNDKALIFNLNIAWLVMPFYLLGNKYKYLKKKITFGKYKYFAWIFLFVIYVYIVWKNDFVDASFLEWGNTILYYVGSSLGVVLSIEFFKKYHSRMRFVIEIGQQSLYILCLHWFLVSPYRKLTYQNESISDVEHFILGGGMSIASILVIMVYLHLSKK